MWPNYVSCVDLVVYTSPKGAIMGRYASKTSLIGRNSWNAARFFDYKRELLPVTVTKSSVTVANVTVKKRCLPKVTIVMTVNGTCHQRFWLKKTKHFGDGDGRGDIPPKSLAVWTRWPPVKERLQQGRFNWTEIYFFLPTTENWKPSCSGTVT